MDVFSVSLLSLFFLLTVDLATGAMNRLQAYMMTFARGACRVNSRTSDAERQNLWGKKPKIRTVRGPSREDTTSTVDLRRGAGRADERIQAEYYVTPTRDRGRRPPPRPLAREPPPRPRPVPRRRSRMSYVDLDRSRRRRMPGRGDARDTLREAENGRSPSPGPSPDEIDRRVNKNASDPTRRTRESLPTLPRTRSS